MPRTADAKPAQIVKCPHCDWKGSARGLFGHVKLSHPGHEGAIRHSTKRVNPYAINKSPKNAIGKPSNAIPTYSKNPGINILIGSIVKIIENYMAMQRNQQEFSKQFQREANKPTTQGIKRSASHL